MRELTVRLEFTQHCLGNVRRPYRDKNVIFAMTRTRSGQVMFLPTWWRTITRYAAQVLNTCQREVKEIEWDPCIDGVPGTWKRYFVPSKQRKSGHRPYVLHEAFLPGDMINVNCVIPTRLSIEDFWRIMDVAGRYRGISPYKPREFGNFTVVEIRGRRSVSVGEVMTEPPS